MDDKPNKLAAFFDLLAKRQQDHEEAKAKERKEKEDAKLAKLRPWWQESAQ